MKGFLGRYHRLILFLGVPVIFGITIGLHFYLSSSITIIWGKPIRVFIVVVGSLVLLLFWIFNIIFGDIKYDWICQNCGKQDKEGFLLPSKYCRECGGSIIVVKEKKVEHQKD